MNFAELRHNRYLRVFFVPFRMRAVVRGSEIGLVIAGVVIGIISGLAVAAIGGISQWMHQALFALEPGEKLSSAAQLYPSAFIAPLAGGILMGIIIWVLARWRKRPIVDPIEANALHGGRLSLTDSFILVGQNLISNGFGASVGLEAAYTQLASGFASRIGRAHTRYRKPNRCKAWRSAISGPVSRLRFACIDRRTASFVAHDCVGTHQDYVRRGPGITAPSE